MEKYRAMILNTSISRKKILESEVVLAISYCVICLINCKNIKNNIEGSSAVICISTLKIYAVIFFVWMCILFMLRNVDGQDLLRAVAVTCALLVVCTILKGSFTLKKIKHEQERILVLGSNVTFLIVMIMLFGTKGLLPIIFFVMVVGVKLLSELLAGATPDDAAWVAFIELFCTKNAIYK